MKPVPSGSSRLRRFQEHFARALIDPTPPDDCGAGAKQVLAQPGFAVYRNTVLKGCIDALQANYPAIARLVGEQWMRAAAAEFARMHLPASPMLLDYGAGFANFLARFEPAQALPYLAGVAQLDRFWNEAHAARDTTPLPHEAVAALAQNELARATLRIHPSARWAWFESQPIFTIWSRNRTASDAAAWADDEIVWQGEGALIVRPFDSVQAIALGRADVALLEACAAGRALADAASAALAADDTADLVPLMARLVTAGAFAAIQLDKP